MTKKTLPNDPPTTPTNNDELDQLLSSIKLTRIRQIIAQHLQAAAKSSPAYSDFLVRLLREEFIHRQQQSIEYRIRQSRLPERLALETFPFKKQPSINAGTIRELAKLDFVARAANITFIGEAGVGKSGLATGLLLKAMDNGYRGYFITAQDLFDEIYTSLADRSTRRLLNRLMRVDLLVIDEMGYLNLRPEQSNAFFKLMHERYAKRSTIITTNLDYPQWYDFLGNKKMVKALLDRLRHRCHTIRIQGESLREPQG
jgi:DNA replication protein DnaC